MLTKTQGSTYNDMSSMELDCDDYKFETLNFVNPSDTKSLDTEQFFRLQSEDTTQVYSRNERYS